MVLNDILKSLNYILYGHNNFKENDDKHSDINIFNYLDYLIQKYPQKINFIFKENEHNDKSYNFCYNYTFDLYINEFYNNIYDINYYSSSFNDNSRGLERSQLKTLSAFRSIIRDNKYISINGGPGTGKSTLLNYIISNILIDNLLIPYWSKYRNMSFVDYIRSSNFKQIWILATGSIVASVENIIDLCKIELPDEHIWFRKDIYYNFLNRLDYSLIYENHNNTLTNKINNYFLSEIDKRKKYFIMCAEKYFNLKYISWDVIPQKCYEKISYNCKLIVNINSSIKEVIDKNDDQIINEYISELNLNNKLNKLVNNMKNQTIDDESKKIFLEQWKVTLVELMKNVKFIFKDISNNEVNLLINQIDNHIDEIFRIGKFKLMFISFKKVKEKVESIKSLLSKLIKISSKKIEQIIKIIKDSINVLNNIFDKDEINEMGLGYFINLNIDNSITFDDMLTIISSFKILQINFNIIQKKMDIKIRSENTYLFRHIQEWLFLDSNATNIMYIFPIISSNIQKFSYKKLNKDYFKYRDFDYVIVDESGQTNAKYLNYLNILSRKIIAVGDSKQLETINDNKILNEKINEIKNSIDQESFNLIKDFLENKLDLIKFRNDQYEFNNISLLDRVNELSNIQSIINDKEYRGLHLLEHFRCPNQIFNLINEFYYDKMLNCPIKDDYSECCISNLVGNSICCDECSLIQIKYKYDKSKTNKDYKVNYNEIEIGLNLIIDNLSLFIKHNDVNYNGILKPEHINYLKKNLAFVTLYKNQSEYIKITIEDIVNKLCSSERTTTDSQIIDITNRIITKVNNSKLDKQYLIQILSSIKCGTIDSLQGIGCDFIIFSNVSETFDENEMRSSFEFNPNRINVLWTRTKKHFIHIMSDSYWNLKNELNNSIYSTRFQAEVTSKNNINRICLNIDDFNNLSFNKLFNSSRYDFTNKAKISEIGKYGEMILENILNDNEMKEIFIDKLYDDLNIDLPNDICYKWLNKENETFIEYDYLLKYNDIHYYLDVKSSIRNTNDFYLSQKEFNFIKDNIGKYIILKINDISKYNINIKNKSCLSFAIKNISSYTYDSNLRRFKNLRSELFYKLRP